MLLIIFIEMNIFIELNIFVVFVFVDVLCFCVGVGYDMVLICLVGMKGLLKKMFSFVCSVVVGCEFVSLGS